MNTVKKSLGALGLACFALAASVEANTLVVAGTILKQTSGTTFDSWTLAMPTAGSFSVNVSAYEASQSSISTAGYFTSDINGDGELTWMDPDSYFYSDDGHLDATDALVRCDDINNNCAVYQNGLDATTSPVRVTSLSQTQGASDGSVHFRRDPAYDVSANAGNYLFLIADSIVSPFLRDLLGRPSLQKEQKFGDTPCLRRPAPSCVRHGSVRLYATHYAMATTND